MKHSFRKTFFRYALLLLLIFSASVACAEGSISGVAFLDENASGEMDSGEYLLSGVPVALQMKTEKGWQRIADTVTAQNGSYIFSGLAEGSYRIISAMDNENYCIFSFGEQGGWTDGVLHSEKLVLSGDETIEGPSAAVCSAARLTVTTFVDQNGNVLQDAKEKNLAGVTLRLVQDGVVISEAVSGSDGIAKLSAPQGNYTLRVIMPSGYAISAFDGDSSYAMSVSSLSKEFVLSSSNEKSFLCAAASVYGMSGTVFEDINSNGIMDDEDLPVSGVVVHAVHKKSGSEYTAVSGEDGFYMMILPVKGTYIITADIPEGMLYARYSKTGGDLRSIFSRTNVSREFTLKNSMLENKNIGIVEQGAIYGTAFLDLNYDGIRDEDEPAYAGVTVEIIKVSSGDSFGKVKTDQNGYFIVEDLRGGDYRVRVLLPDDGSVFSTTAEGEADEVNLFVQKSGRRESSLEPVTLTSGEQKEVLIGIAKGSTVSGKVFQDSDYSGIQNGKEKGISGIKVRAVSDTGEVAAEATSDKNGKYTLDGILPGSYRIEFQRKSGYGFTRSRSEQSGGSDVITIENSWGVCEYLTVAMDQSITDINAGMLPSATVKGSLIHDTNDNGKADSGEKALEGASVRLWSEDAEMDFTVTPDAKGNFSFEGVMPGTYNLEYILPDYCEMTLQEAKTEKVLKVVSGESYELPQACAVKLGVWKGKILHGSEGVQGVKLSISGASGAEDITAQDGSFSLEDLHPGSYELSIELPDGYIFKDVTNAAGVELPSDNKATITISWDLLTAHDEKVITVLTPSGLSGAVWMDETLSGSYDAGEWIMEELRIVLMDENGNILQTAYTGENGFTFDKVRAGTYFLGFNLPEQSSPVGEKGADFSLTEGVMISELITLQEGEQISDLNVGLVSTTSLGGTILLDELGSQTPVAGASVSLLRDGQVQSTLTTGDDGIYRFDGLMPDTYQVRITLPVGDIFIRESDTAYATSLIHAESGNTAESGDIVLEMAKHQLSLDVLCIKSGMVGDLAWLDENANGLLDGDERRLPGIKVKLLQDGVVKYEEVTDVFGYYLFDDVYPGEYVLVAEAYSELALTTPVPALRIISSCLISGDGSSATSESFSIASGEKNMNFDLGYVLKDGCSLPAEAIQEVPTKDWTIINTSPKTLK